MPLDVTHIASRMERIPAAVAALVSGLTDEDARRRSPAGAWSVLEIICHLADEECEDFRPRIQSTLRDPAAKWAPINPEAAAKERNYNDRDLRTELDRFTRERAASVAWLRDLKRPDWSATYRVGKPGPLSAGQLLASWAAHDALHIRQIAKRLFELAQRDADGASIAYAGEWGA